MHSWIRRLTPLTVLAAVLAGFAFVPDAAKSQPPDKKGPDKAGIKAPSIKVESGPFKIEVSLKGIFESSTMTEVSIKPESWNSMLGGLVVVKAVESGTAVKKGDVLLTLDTEKIDKAIREQELDQQLAELAFRQTELDLPILERTTPLDLAAAERSKERSDEDLRKFLSVDKPLSVEMAHFQVRSSANSLEYAEEELKQLQKMYRKDLTEETEEIILKRQRNAVEQSKFMLKVAEDRRDQTLKVELPRREQNLRESAAKAALSWDRAQISLPIALNQKRLSLEKAKQDRVRSTEKLANLKKDRELFTIKSPADGIVYYGRCVQGNWPTASSLVNRLQKGGTISGEEVFMTIVQPRPLFVRTSVDEKDVTNISVGSACKVTPAAQPEVRIDGKVEKLANVPVGGNFEARVTVDSADAALMPGMTCTIKIVPYSRESAITLPAVAIFDDDLNDDKHFVYRVGSDGPEKRPVTLGKRSGGRVEITSGLKAGDEVLLAKP